MLCTKFVPPLLLSLLTRTDGRVFACLVFAAPRVGRWVRTVPTTNGLRGSLMGRRHTHRRRGEGLSESDERGREAGPEEREAERRRPGRLSPVGDPGWVFQPMRSSAPGVPTSSPASHDIKPQLSPHASGRTMGDAAGARGSFVLTPDDIDAPHLASLVEQYHGPWRSHRPAVPAARVAQVRPPPTPHTAPS